MHVCFVLPPTERYTARGGAIATVTRHLAAELTGRGHRVSVLGPSPDPEDLYQAGDYVALDPAAVGPVRRLRIAEAQLRRWSWPDYGDYLHRVRSALVRVDRPDVLVAANDPDLVVALARAPVGRRVLWLHNLLGPGDGRRLAAASRTAQLVGVSDAVARWTERAHRLAPGSVAVVHNGVDPEEFRPRIDFRRPVGVPAVLCHGRLTPGKGFDVAVAAVRRCRADGVPLSLSVAGAARSWGRPADDIERFARDLLAELEASGGTYLGSLPADEMAPVVGRHDVVCVPSRSEEPFGLSALEGMASGCAVVASDRGGLPEVVGDAGILVPVDDPASLAAALTAVVRDPVALVRAKERARARALELTWSASVERFLAVLAGAAGGRPGAGGTQERPTTSR